MLQSYCTAVFHTQTHKHTHTHTPPLKPKKKWMEILSAIRGAQDITLKILHATQTSVSVFSVSQDSNFPNSLHEFKALEHLVSLNCSGAHTLSRNIFFLEYYLNPGFYETCFHHCKIHDEQSCDFWLRNGGF